MATTTVFGYVGADRSTLSGSGFRVGQKIETGVYNIIFDTPFDDVPAVTATVHDPGQTGHQTGLHVTEVDTGQVTVVIVNTENQDRYDLPFFFIATGPGDATA